MITPPRATKPPKIQRVATKNWLNGTVTANDTGRTPIDGLLNSGNVILTQDGTIRPRPSLVPYGPQPLGPVLGEIYEFRKVTGGTVENWMISVQNISGTARVCVARGEDNNWTVVTSTSYSTTAPAHFVQIAGKILIMNGVNNLSYYDIVAGTVTTYTQINAPTVPNTTATGLTGTNFNVYYAITANSTVGETEGSPVKTQAVSTDRDLWNPDTQKVTVTWTAVTNARSYNVYLGVSADGAGQPKLYAIATGLDPSTLSFEDNGSRAQDLSRPLPTSNSTAGPKAKRGDVSNGRVFLVGDPTNPYYVYRGGDFGFELDFSPANGGGYTPVGQGTKDIPNNVKSYRNGKGDALVMVLSQGTNGSGRRSYLSPQTITYGQTSFVVWQVTEDSGKDGTDSPDAVIIYQNNAYYPSRDGFKTTGTKPQLQNILSTDRISNTIQPDIATLNTDAMDMAVGIAYEGRLYFALPVGSDTNNEIWVLDLDRKGAWMKPWNIAADWMTLYNDNSGQTHFLVLQNDMIYEMSYSAKTFDNGTPFSTLITSGQVKFSEDSREWGRVIQIVFVLLRPQGTLNFTVSGMTEDGIVSFDMSESFANNSTRGGWSEPRAGWSSFRGWSEIITVPQTFNDPVQEVILEIDEDVQWYQYQITSTESGVDYSLSDVISEYVNIGMLDLSR